MDSSESNRTAELLLLADFWGNRRFGRDADPTKISDVVSVAWEFYKKYPHAPLSELVWFACKRVASGRVFGLSRQSIDHPTRRPQSDPQSGQLDLKHISRVGDDPAEIVAFRLDFAAWVSRLTDRQVAMLEALAMGATTTEVAQHFGCSCGIVSRYRRRLAESWERFE